MALHIVGQQISIAAVLIIFARVTATGKPGQKKTSR